MPRSQTKRGRKRGPLYVVHSPTYANLEPEDKNRPAVKALVNAYMQRGPCTMTEALDYTQGLPDAVPRGTVKWWDAKLKQQGVIKTQELLLAPAASPAALHKALIEDIQATLKAFREARVQAASRFFQ